MTSTLRDTVTNVYKHITYCGTISASILIYYNTFFMDTFDINLHKQTLSLACFKSFMLYDSTPVEYIHHAIQLFLSFVFYFPLDNIHSNTIQLNEAYKLTYCILFTPVFNNIKFYVPVKYTKIRLSLDAMTAFFFFYYRTQFSYLWLSSNGRELLIEMFGNYSPVFNTIAYILTGMNVYWGYKIINIIKNKTLKMIKLNKD